MMHVDGWVCGPQRTAFGAVLASIHLAGSRVNQVTKPDSKWHYLLMHLTRPFIRHL